jgi:2-polyprenyl-3-methyl-5-hydroxy-6-metoxy-1,4-benzoquinol methylase
MHNPGCQEAAQVPPHLEASGAEGGLDLLQTIQAYWNAHIHDLEITKHPVGTQGFFEDLREYRFDKLRYLPKVIDFSAFRDKRLLEIGCGVGIDLVEFAKHGSAVTGIDVAESAIELARRNLAFQGVHGDLQVMNGEALKFPEESFDVVYAHGVLQYTADARRMVTEIHRVLRPGGEALLMVYNRYSWLNLLSVVLGVALEHEDAPVLEKYSARQFTDMLGDFAEVQLLFERFPVKTRLHGGLKGTFYNTLFVPFFNSLPRVLVRRSGWHLLAKAKK